MTSFDPADFAELAGGTALHGTPETMADAMFDQVIGIAIVVYEMYPPRR